MTKHGIFETGFMADGVDKLTDNLTARGVNLGGAQATSQLVKPHAEHTVATYFRSSGTPLGRGFFAHKVTGESLADANALLAGHVVLRGIEQRGKVQIYPAVVSPDGLKTPWRMKITTLMNSTYNPHRGLTPDQHFHLSAHAQSETADIGLHGDQQQGIPSVDPEHLIALFGVSRDPQDIEQWKRGFHPNHDARQITSALDQSVQKGMYTSRYIDPQTVPITHSLRLSGMFDRPSARWLLWSQTPTKLEQVSETTILWHEKLVSDTNEPLKADFKMATGAGETQNALQLVQGVGYMSLLENTQAWNATQQLMEGI